MAPPDSIGVRLGSSQARPLSATWLRLAVTGSPDLDSDGGTVLREQLAFLKQDKKALVRLAAKIGTSVSDSRAESTTHTVSSRLWPVNQTNSKPGSASGSTGTAPASLTTPVKKYNKSGSQEWKRIKRAKAARAPIGTLGSTTTEKNLELKARADAKADADTQVSRAETLQSRPGMPENWEWDQIVTEDELCEE
eukprot:847704-Rhodomonas_salina.1